MTEPTDRLRRYGEDIASAVSPARSRVAAMRAIGQAQRSSFRNVPRIAFATLAGFVVLNVITAGVADAAVPGDMLYPLDRGYEKAAGLIGMGDDHSDERLAEAEILVTRADFTGALDLVAESVDDEEIQEAVSALQGSDHSDPSLPSHVQALLEGVHQMVAARQTGGDVEEARAAVHLLAIQIRELSRQSDSDRTGPPDHAGPPDQPGRQGPPDQPGEQSEGRPDPAGQQGPPDHADDTGPGPPDQTTPPQANDPAEGSNPGQGNQPPPPSTGGDPAGGRQGPPPDGGNQGSGRGGGRP